MTGDEPFLPFFLPDLGEAEIAAVVEVLRSGWLTTGAKTKEFERLFAERIGVKHAVAVNSATAALHLALEAIDVKPGDEVIVPTMTFASTAEVVAYLGAKPVLVDCLEDTLCIDPAATAAAITPRTKAIMPVHYAGQPCDMEPILKAAEQHGVKVIEDAAHALPAAYRGQTIGTLGAATCFSFYANKTITTGEGGMLVTGDDAVADRARIMSLHGISRDAWKRFTAEGSWYYEILRPGFKYNLTDVAAALGIVQLGRCDEFWQRRAALARQYDELLADVDVITRPTSRDDVTHAWHLYVVKLNLERLQITRNQFIEELKRRRIGHSVHYTPLHMHPYYRETYGYQPGDLPVARSVYERIVSLPLFPKMTDADQDRVVAAIKEIAAEHGR
ncbi:MAG: DegT/DnrJ/EryC1/StrS family aminotransferase [Pirellulales bacterium]